MSDKKKSSSPYAKKGKSEIIWFVSAFALLFLARSCVMKDHALLMREAEARRSFAPLGHVYTITKSWSYDHDIAYTLGWEMEIIPADPNMPIEMRVGGFYDKLLPPWNSLRFPQEVYLVKPHEKWATFKIPGTHYETESYVEVIRRPPGYTASNILALKKQLEISAVKE
jgi:hypothetical protein